MINLVDSGVVFNEENHTYFLGEKELFGITGMIKRQLFPDKYKEIPQHILAKAAERGTQIHHDCQFADTTGFEPMTIEAKNYVAMREAAGYCPLANEYTVTDGDYFASNIDCVWQKKEGLAISLVDVKTTYKPDIPYLTWQLSIYAYLFELQNPTLKVESIYGAWVHSINFNLIPLERIVNEEVKRLLDCERNGRKYLEQNTVVEKVESDVQLLPKDVISRYLEAVQRINELTPIIDNFKSGLKKAMDENGVKSWDIGSIKATITPEGTKKSFDAKKFQSDHPDLYQEYLKESKTSASIRITIRKDDKE